jgi:DNA-directed RNA polymerase subunit RPC12/RpoP
MDRLARREWLRADWICPDLSLTTDPVRCLGTLGEARDLDSELLVILSLTVGLGGTVMLIVALVYRCSACGSLAHGFKSDKQADFDSGDAYIVCRKCGDRQLKGKVESDGSVMWFSGGSGQFDKDGSYTGDAGGAWGDGGAGDGGGGDGGGGGE